MKLGFLYAGQGSQKVGMGHDFYEKYPTFRHGLDCGAVDFDLKSVTFDDPNGQIHQTRYTQPCMVAFALGVTDLLRERGIVPSAALGLSLGEYSALYSAGVIDATTAISLVAYRGQVMEEAVAGMQSAMAAVLGLDRTALQLACDEASSFGVVEIANYNCPGQLVIGGEVQAVAAASGLAKDYGAKRCIPLKVSGPFHTSLLKSAGEKLGQKLVDTTLKAPTIPVLYNCLGGENEEGISIATLLERQVSSSVYLEDCIRSMGALGVDAMVEIGPGKVLSGFVRKILPDMQVYPMECCGDLDALVEVLSKEVSHGV